MISTTRDPFECDPMLFRGSPKVNKSRARGIGRRMGGAGATGSGRPVACTFFVDGRHLTDEVTCRSDCRRRLPTAETVNWKTARDAITMAIFAIVDQTCVPGPEPNSTDVGWECEFNRRCNRKRTKKLTFFLSSESRGRRHFFPAVSPSDRHFLNPQTNVCTFHQPNSRGDEWAFEFNGECNRNYLPLELLGASFFSLHRFSQLSQWNAASQAKLRNHGKTRPKVLPSAFGPLYLFQYNGKHFRWEHSPPPPPASQGQRWKSSVWLPIRSGLYLFVHCWRRYHCARVKDRGDPNERQINSDRYETQCPTATARVWFEWFDRHRDQRLWLVAVRSETSFHFVSRARSGRSRSVGKRVDNSK